MILYHYPLSPMCRKLRLLLAEQGKTFRLDSSPAPEILALAPTGEPPILVADGHVLADHAVISEYLAEVNAPSFLGETPLERAEVRRMVRWFDEKFFWEATLLIVEERVKKRLMNQEPDAGRILSAKKSLKALLASLSERLEAQKKMVGDSLSMADFAGAAHLSVLDYMNEIPWNRYPDVKEWYVCMKSRPSFRPLLEERVRGFFPPDHYSDLDF